MTSVDDPFGHIRPMFREKVRQDIATHWTPDHQWDMDGFNPLNDYQRHLYALHLRLAGLSLLEVWAAVFPLTVDVEEKQRGKYTDEICHSEIVGFSRLDGSLLKMPAQEVAGVRYQD